MTPLGIGVVGCGGAAVDMCRAIDGLASTSVVAVYDRVAERATDIAAARAANVHLSLEALLADSGVNIAYVALPHHLLAPSAEHALLAGKHVLVEKPMGLDVPTIRSLKQLADKRGLAIAPVFELRASAVFREARGIVEGGALGSVTMTRIETVIDKPDDYWQSGPRGVVRDSWRARRSEAGGGVVLMNSIHQLDLVTFVTGLSYARVAAEAATLYAEVEVEDAAVAVLRLSNDGIASLVAAAHSPGAVHEERTSLDGTLGRLDLPDPSDRNGHTLRLFLRRPWNELPAGRWLELEVERNDPYLDFLRDFVDVIRQGGVPIATADDAVAALATVRAIYEASSTGTVLTIGAEATVPMSGPQSPG